MELKQIKENKEKDHVKIIITSLSNQMIKQQEHPLRFHFFNLYHSALKHLLDYFVFFQKTRNVEKESHKKNLIAIIDLILLAENYYSKLVSNQYFSSFGKNNENKEILMSLYDNYNAIIMKLKENRYFGLKIDTLFEISEPELENKLHYLDEAIKYTDRIVFSEENNIEFNNSLKFLQNDLSYIFFVHCLRKSGSSTKRLLKSYDFLQYLSKFLQELEGLTMNEDHMLLIQKKLRFYEVGNSISANKISLFFNEIWGDIFERNRILKMKNEPENKASEDYLTLVNERRISLASENETIELEDNKKGIFFEEKSNKKEDCVLF